MVLLEEKTIGGINDMNEHTVNKMIEMKLLGMAEGYQHQATNENYRTLDFEERFQLLVDQEYDRRKNNRLKRLIKSADFQDSQACMEDIEYFEDRRLDKGRLTELSSGQYIRQQHNVVLKGPTGAGKSFIAQALGVEACRQYHTVKYYRLPELLDELVIAREKADGSYRKQIKRLSKVELLIIDEWLLTELNFDYSSIILEVIELRYKQKSTIFCSQIDTEGWSNYLGNGTLADAILDRIIHNSYQLFIDGEVSMRERYGLSSELDRI